ncbi:hypothetical protein K440DRAFT_662987 [Wilcoxina mikolae CBS 423.85]|nr:hypothetical protein K440DRAFT_662987 [Wilcoxina mikolae CBS 423.85]
MSAPIDPSSISSWEDAFQHPIPQVRQLERQLRADLSSNKEKLRGLVGESYRDLLQTAERIIDMDVAAQNVEARLGEASRNCNSRLLERKAKNLKGFNDMMDKRDREKYTFAAQLSVLHACPSVISRLLHNDQGDSCLLAAKVFVISRLLLKSLSEKSSLPLLTTLRSQFLTLRPILLQHIDTLLSSITLSSSLLVSTLTAFSVLKTSSPSEVLRHFLYIRSTALSSLHSGTDPDAILKSVTLFNKTLKDADATFPGLLSDALVTLKSKSLLQDTEVADLPELGLDVNVRWLPEDIRGFIPWVRHDDLEASRVQEIVRTWAEKEVGKLNESLETFLSAMDCIASIVKLRGGMLALWRSGKQIRRKILSDGNIGGGENFRNIIMARVVAVMKSVAEDLRGVGEKIEQLLNDAEYEAEDSTSLWPATPLPVDLSNGVSAFRTAISNRVHGKSPVVLSFLSTYNSWLTKISVIATIFRDIRSTDPQSPETEDEDFEAEEERTQAGMEDSLLAEKELTAALDGVYRLLENSLNSLLDLTPLTRRQATFLLRAVRQIRQLTPKRQGDDANPIISLTWFGVDTIPKLHLMIAAFVTMKPLDNVASLLKRRKWEEPVVSKPLWEGEGELLPVQPSPLVFRFLHDLVIEMRNTGEDVWTPAAVKCVKAGACNKLWAAMEEVLQRREFGDPEPLANVKEEEEEETKVVTEPKVENGDKVDVDVQSPPNDTNNEDHNPLPADADAPATNGDTDTLESKSAPEPVLEPAPTPAPSPAPKPARITRDWTLQLLFDSLYLDEALHRKRRRGSTNGSSVTSLVGKVDSFIGAKLALDEELRMRLEGSASEYWKRTCLLFALLS